jgi:uncharacterized radical SAM superfamily Fe-S cluster-containing enzyme
VIDILEKEEIRYSLVATIVKGVNCDEIVDIVDFFFESKALSLMFQPAAYTGRAEKLASEERRATIPDVVREVEKSKYVTKGDFNPLPCSHYACFALAYYLIVETGNYLSLKEFLGKEAYLDVIANRTLPGLDADSYATIKEKIYDFWSASDASSSDKLILKRIREVMKEIGAMDFSPKAAFSLGAKSMKALFVHQFMDKYTLDFGRLVKCCNQYPQVDGRLIPMGSMNVFGL